MRDFYKRLGVAEGASENDLRAALVAAESATREAGEFVLLDPERREVYDRNRRVLNTIGRLRANLGLNLTRFWPRARFADFTHDLAPAAAHNPSDPMAMAWAFGVEPPRARRGRTPLLRRGLAAGFVLAAAAALLFSWRLSHGG